MSEPISPQGHVPSTSELQEFEAKFGPFVPPADFQFEPEFRYPPPRTIPAEVRQGPYCRKQQRILIGWFVASLVLAACSLLPIVQVWGLYLLPLQYLHWGAAGALVFTGIGWIRYIFGHGPLVYIGKGTPLVVRIAALFPRTKLVAEGVSSTEYVAVLQHYHPRTGEVVFSTTSCLVPDSAKDNVTVSYRVGDYVTAVYLKTNFEKSLRLYGFLNLRPNLGIIPATKAKECSVLQLVSGIVCIGGLFFLLGWDCYAFSKYEPVEISIREHWLPFAIGAATLGLGLIAFIAYAVRKDRAKPESGNQQAVAEGGGIETPSSRKFVLLGHGLITGVVFLFGAILLGGGTMLGWAFTLNAWCDSSPAELRPIHVREMWMKTHNFVFRNYTIEYEFAGDPAQKKRELLTTPWHMVAFGGARTGAAHVRKGFLGWPWVETLTPDAPKAFPAPRHQPPKDDN